MRLFTGSTHQKPNPNIVSGVADALAMTETVLPVLPTLHEYRKRCFQMLPMLREYRKRCFQMLPTFME